MKSIKKIKQDLQKLIFEGKINHALVLIQEYVSQINQDPLTLANVFSFSDLDELCLQIGSKISKTLELSVPTNNSETSGTVIILASNLDKYGGHSKVVLNLLATKSGAHIKVILTDIFDINDFDFLGLSEQPIVPPTELTHEAKLFWLMKICTEINPRKIVLFNHHQDSVAIAAVEPWLRLGRVAYYHHADHALSLGVRLPNAVHIDPHNLGFFGCREREGLSENIYIPLSVADKGFKEYSPLSVNEKNLTTCSSGSYSYKFAGDYEYGYIDLICERLSISPGNHIHIGDLSDEVLREFRSRILNLSLDPNRLIHHPWVHSLWDSFHDFQVDLYISSFPVGGGMATIEAMGAGIPILIHESYLSRFHGGADLAYPEALVWGSKEDFIEAIKGLSAEDLVKASHAARNHYDTHHSIDFLKNFILDDLLVGVPKPPALRSYHPNLLLRYEHYKNLHRGANFDINLLLQKVTKLNLLLEFNKEKRKELSGLLRFRNQELAELHHQIHSLHVEMGNVFKSFSWRITGPLRVVLRSIRPLKQGAVRLALYYKNVRIAYKHPAKKILRTIRQVIHSPTGSMPQSFGAEEEIAKFLVSFKNFFYSDTDKFYELKDLTEITLFKKYKKEDFILFFDHNGGGGSNFFSSEFIKNNNYKNKNIVRIFYSQDLWLVEVRTLNAVKYSFSMAIDALFEWLSKFYGTSIVINSLYGHPNIFESIDFIIALKKKAALSLEYMIHDYHVVCPSPHLINYRQKYCEIPSKLEVCRDCLHKNHSWYHSWIPIENRPSEIEHWRGSFERLLASANKITIFDYSSFDIILKVYPDVEDKIVLSPHNNIFNLRPCKSSIDLKKSLHIGIIGTLTSLKGLAVVNDLADYIDINKMDIPITVIGDVGGAVSKTINVMGKYEVSELPEKIERAGINIILMASITPETFSYTISQAIEMQLPIVAFDLGAQGKRVGKYSLGMTVTPKAPSSEILHALCEMHAKHLEIQC